MTGHAMFNEVFLDDARVPDDAIIGDLNNGWAVANTTLANERAGLGAGRRRAAAGHGHARHDRRPARPAGRRLRPHAAAGAAGAGAGARPRSSSGVRRPALLIDLAKGNGTSTTRRSARASSGCTSSASSAASTPSASRRPGPPAATSPAWPTSPSWR